MRLVNDNTEDILDPEACMSKIFEISGAKFEPDLAFDLWAKILQHKWLLSEKLGRDVGLRIACIDFLENKEQALNEFLNYKQKDLLKELGALAISREIWDTISDSQPPKQLVQRRIILPYTEADLSKKHGVVPPKTIIFFGPPGTGKTHFVKAIAGILSWWYVEIVPSMLMAEGVEKVGANLRMVLEKARNLEDAVIFIDEFEEIAGSRDHADRIDKSITNELLKQVALFKNGANKALLVCATNYIRDLDPALLRPGRFDCIIPVGGMKKDERRTVLQYYLSRVNAGEVDVEQINQQIARYTPADIQYLFERVAQLAFEQELANKQETFVTTETVMAIVKEITPTLTDEAIEAFEKDARTFSRS
jgi:transitional endoplasmic reticulum ATPase